MQLYYTLNLNTITHATKCLIFLVEKNYKLKFYYKDYDK